MPISHRVDSPTYAGLVTPFLNVDKAFATVEGSFTMTRLDLRLTDAPSGGTVTVMVNTETGGGGSDLLSGTILDGTDFISVTGSIVLSGTTTFYLRVTAESGSAMGISASVEVSLADGTTVDVLLSTLEAVKESGKITDVTNDAILTRHLRGVSRAMQNWMGRTFTPTVLTEERHFPTGLNSGIVVNRGPIISVEEIRIAGTVLATTDYRTEGNRMIRRVSGESRIAWARNSEVELDYTAGYALIPADIFDAAAQETLRQWFGSKGSGGPGLHVVNVTPSVGDAKEFSTDEFLPYTIAVMKPYRRFML